MPATCCPQPASMWVSGGENAAKIVLIWGKPKAGIVFQTSCTVGVLLTSMPNKVFWPNSVPDLT